MSSSCRLSPSGAVRIDSSAALPEALVAAFSQGTGAGLLHLGAVAVDTALPPELAWWRELGEAVVSAVCATVDPTDPGVLPQPRPDPEELALLAGRVPPMPGSERVDTELLAGLWQQTLEALGAAAAGVEGGLPAWLSQANPKWNLAGRVCLHLAENKRRAEQPFAFIATYARSRPGRAGVQHLPLRLALQEFAGEGLRQRLLALLEPLQRAAEGSEVVRQLLDSGQIYHPLAWTPAEAHALLKDAEVLERAGLVLRLPDWWRRGGRRRPRVTVTVGEQAPSTLGLQALVSFDVGVSLGGERLSQAELRALLEGTAGLALVRGGWVEVDPEKLRELLSHWDSVAEQAEAGGVSLAEAARLLAGADLEGAGQGNEPQGAPEWSEVVAGSWLSARLDELRSPGIGAQIAQGAGLQATLRPYQQQGVQWLWSLYSLGIGGCLADDMGLGKTIQVIALLSLLRAREGEDTGGQDLLVVPASLVETWRAELERFAPHLRVLVAHPSAMPSSRLKQLPAEEIDAHQVLITTYGTVHRTPWFAERTWRVLALDEAQAIKNPGARQTRSIKALPSRWRLVLTGTPVENRLSDLWSLFDFTSPGLLGSGAAFGRFTKAMARDARDGGPGYAPLRRLVRPYILRRLKTDRSIIADLPDKTELTTRCLLTRKQAALYTQAVEELATAIRETSPMERRGLVLAALMRFKQICNHPSQWLADGDFSSSHSGKFQRLAELMEPISARQEKVLVFTQFRSMTEPLAEHLAGCFGRPGLVLHGGTPVKQRAKLVARFQEDDELPFMVLSLKAGGTGLTLTAANHVVHFDRWWNPAVEDQATDRAYRIGQHRNVLVHKLVCTGTVEERIDELILGKQSLARDVLAAPADGSELRLTELDDKELLDLVSLDLARAVST